MVITITFSFDLFLLICFFPSVFVRFHSTQWIRVLTQIILRWMECGGKFKGKFYPCLWEFELYGNAMYEIYRWLTPLGEALFMSSSNLFGEKTALEKCLAILIEMGWVQRTHLKMTSKTSKRNTRKNEATTPTKWLQCTTHIHAHKKTNRTRTIVRAQCHEMCPESWRKTWKWETFFDAIMPLTWCSFNRISHGEWLWLLRSN